MTTVPRGNGDDSSSSGVSAPDGYTADTGSMVSQAQAISDAVEEAQPEAENLGATEVAGADFGIAHAERAAGYTAAVRTLGEGAMAMCGSLLALAGSIGGAGEQYASAEAEQQSSVNQSGSGL
ncbi:hypothetical protein BAY61_02975 [Prauserella marina]|uniref:Uncharacterized protein n=1 Tax=Prauserella marina TaxID=530584 RepID=A0A222VJP7_9PSEU|nr:hypothetical protein [Prauserella marina]ASR34127.1 hypothetical protein BAY61_02975 [Prauserella marina]PWV82770.1 hypothetical protein DES30_1021017 [Prauserella marina]SDC76870.1 hypothetical protein SAMN05421630_103553 [Prauserella marina]